MRIKEAGGGKHHERCSRYENIVANTIKIDTDPLFGLARSVGETGTYFSKSVFIWSRPEPCVVGFRYL